MDKGLCLVLGANGFIGSHLVDELAAQGYAVRAFDRFQTEPQPKFNVTDNVEVFKGDIYDSDALQASLKDVAYVFHCFSATTPFSSDSDPLTDIEKNLKPSVNIFQSCIDAGIKKVIFVSSGGAVYGPVAEEKAALEADAPTPVSPYGIAKLAIEGYLAYFHRKYGLDYIVYRLSNPYGPRQAFRNNQGVIPAFLAQIAAHETLKIYGDGSSSRDYIYIGDATKMIVDTFARDTRYPLYNLGSGKQTSLKDIIGVLEQVVNTDFNVEYLPSPKTFLRSASISVSRFRDEFGDYELTNLSDGIKTIVD